MKHMLQPSDNNCWTLLNDKIRQCWTLVFDPIEKIVSKALQSVKTLNSSGKLELDDKILIDGHLWRTKLDPQLVRISRDDLLRMDVRGTFNKFLKIWDSYEYDEVWIIGMGLYLIEMTNTFGEMSSTIYKIFSSNWISQAGWAMLSNDLIILIKKQNYLDYRYCYLELINLSGYKTKTDFDPTNDIVGFSEVKPFDRGPWTIADLELQLRTLPVREGETFTFLEYLQSCSYTTGGSSNLAKVEGYVNGTFEKFKGKKSWLPIVKEAEELYTICQTAREFECRVGIKPELGKIRFFVGFSDAGYLIQDYILRLLGKFYKNVTGMTLDENGYEEFERSKKMCSELTRRYSLPFDYKNFDKQITGDEMRLIFSFLISRVRDRISDEDSWILESFMLTLTQSYLMWNDVKYPWRSGLYSGQRVTSLVGNLWNWAWTSILTRGMDITSFYIRGDDSVIIAREKKELEKLEKKYDEANIIGNKLKYAIMYEHTEFLRNTYSKDMIYGNLVRSCASCVERKPWNEAPIEAKGKLKQFFSNYGTFMRRCGVWNLSSQLTRLARGVRQDVGWLTCPKGYGGCGMAYASENRSLDFKYDLTVNVAPTRTYLTQLAKTFDSFDLTEKELVQLTYSREKGLMSLDNIVRVDIEKRISEKGLRLADCELTYRLGHGKAPFHRMDGLFVKYKEVAAVRHLNPWTELLKQNAQLALLYRSLAKRGARKKDAINWLVSGSCDIVATFPDRCTHLVLSLCYGQELPTDLTDHYLVSLQMKASSLLTMDKSMQYQLW